MWARVATVAVALLSGCAAATNTQEASAPSGLTGDFAPAHDPVMMRAGNRYYVYSTGLGTRQPLMARRSSDLRIWQSLPSPVPAIPAWARDAVPGAQGFWAPDIARVNGRFRLYYSVSTFGSQRSAIGLATSASLDPAAPDYGWRDEGVVITSKDGDDFNAIDPNFVADRDGRHWLAFGSFWGGAKLIELDPRTGKPLPHAKVIGLARRDAAQNHAIEAPFVVEHGGWYFLIVSLDHCCRGVRSDYRLAVGRSRSITGPYLDRDGRAMNDGGGTILLQAREGDRFRGPGHAGHYRTDDGRDLLVHHAYDAKKNGRATLRIARLHWDEDGWPRVGPLWEQP